MVIFCLAVFTYSLIIPEVILRAYYLAGVLENRLAALVIQSVKNLTG